MSYMKTYEYDPTTNLNGPIQSRKISGAVKFAARPNAQSAKYLALVTDQGEIRVFYKDGSFAWGFNAGFNPDELSVNDNGEVLLRQGTTIRMYDSVGGGRLKWTQVIASLIHAKIGTSYVACYINTGVAATSGVQWRSLTDGSLVQGVYGTAAIPLVESYAMDIDSTGDIAYICYRLLNQTRLERHVRTTGRAWSNLVVAAHVPSNSVSCNYDGSIVAVCHYSGNDSAVFYDGAGTLLGTSVIAGVTGSNRVKVNPVGDRAIHFRKNATLARRVITTPFSDSAMTVTNAISNVDDPCDASEEKVFFIAEQDLKIHVYEDSGTEITSADVPINTGVLNNHIAVIRNV